MLDTLSYSSCDRLLEPGDPSERINPQPCVPSVVTTCIRFVLNHQAKKLKIREIRNDSGRIIMVMMVRVVVRIMDRVMIRVMAVMRMMIKEVMRIVID